MREISELMDHYRDSARHVWNTAFWPFPERRNWDARAQFDQIKTLLFKSLVVSSLVDTACCDLASLPDVTLRVVPRAGGPVPIMIEHPRAGDRNHYWDDPVREVEASAVELHFLDYFDWDSLAIADFRYYRVRIAAFPTQPRLAGREALLEYSHAGVFAEG